MKKLPFSWAAPVLLAPALAIVVLMLLSIGPTGCGSSSSGPAPTPVPTQGNVEIGLQATAPTNFQSLLLNLVAVRMNPSTDASVPDSDPNWVAIGVPPGIGGGGDLQVNLNLIQSQVKIFNIAQVAAQVYNQIELQIDGTIPGSVIPACGIAPLEGCVTFPLIFSSGFSSSNLRATAPGGVNIAANVTTPLVLNFNPGKVAPLVSSPIATPTSGPAPVVIAPYVMSDPTISVVSASNPSPLLGGITGLAAAGQTVFAETTGTNTIIASTQAFGAANGKANLVPFSLQVPANAAGTTYDLYATGFNPVTTGAANITTAAFSGITVFPGQTVPNINFQVTTGSTGFLTGNIASSTTAQGIQGATLTLLIPPLNNSSLNCLNTPESCVVVATANTDEAGNYPLPGNAFVAGPFNFLAVQSYTLQIKAPGYNTLMTGASPSAGTSAPTCDNTNNPNNCSQTLSNTTISGLVTVDTPPPAGTNVQVMIVAEDSGTSKLENVALTTIVAGATQATFTINVPTTPATFDLVASAEDLYLGDPSPFTGHQFAIQSGVPGGATGVDLSTVSCVGQASVTGVALNPDAGTTVGIYKSNVAVQHASVLPAGTPGAGGFILCVPPDDYTVQRFENGNPTGPTIPVTVATPMPTSSPCPSICGSSASCPGICSNVPLSGNL